MIVKWSTDSGLDAYVDYIHSRRVLEGRASSIRQSNGDVLFTGSQLCELFTL
jgi:hypothetical protein